MNELATTKSQQRQSSSKSINHIKKAQREKVEEDFLTFCSNASEHADVNSRIGSNLDLFSLYLFGSSAVKFASIKAL
jgi:hypothetical protein